MKRYFKSLDSLLAAAELSRLGRHEEAARFLVSATKMPEYAEMVESMTDEQEDLKAQQEQEQQEQASSPALSAALARVLGSETADMYPDEYTWQDDEMKDEEDLLNQGTEHASEDQQQEQQDQQQEQASEEQRDQDNVEQEDLGIDLDDPDDAGEVDREELSSEDEQDEQQEQQATVTAALRVVEASHRAPAPAVREVASNKQLAERLARNRAARS